MTDRELMQMALDSLLRVWHSERNIKHSEAIEALRARLSQPEPVACHCDSPAWCNQYKKCHRAMLGFEPYVAPPQCEWQNTADKCELKPVPAKGTLLPAQPEPKPMGWEKGNYGVSFKKLMPHANYKVTATIAPQREWRGLTDEDFPAMRDGDHSFYSGMFWAESKLKEKNG